MSLAFRGGHRSRRRSTLYALLAATLALAGCSDIFGGRDPVPVEEVIMVDDDGNSFVLAGRSAAAHFHMAIARGDTHHVRFRFANQNGVPVTNTEAYAVNVINIANPALFAWRSESARSGVFTGLANGYTTFRVDVLRGDSIIYHSARIGVDIYTRPSPAH